MTSLLLAFSYATLVRFPILSSVSHPGKISPTDSFRRGASYLTNAVLILLKVVGAVVALMYLVLSMLRGNWLGTFELLGAELAGLLIGRHLWLGIYKAICHTFSKGER